MSGRTLTSPRRTAAATLTAVREPLNLSGGQVLELYDVRDVDAAHRHVGDPLEDYLDDNRHPVLGDHRFRLFQGRVDLAGLGYSNGLAAQALRHLDVIDAVAVGFRGIDVVERQLNLVIHCEAALGLPDQTQVRIVDHDVDVRNVELRADRQFFDHELEVVVAGQRNHGHLGLGDGNSEGGGQGPAQRPGLSAVDPVAGLEHVQELGTGDLGQTDGGDVAGVPAEGPVHLLVDPLGLDRDVVEMGAALQGGFARLGFLGPHPPIG